MVHKSYAAQEDDDGDNDGEIKGRTMMMMMMLMMLKLKDNKLQQVVSSILNQSFLEIHSYKKFTFEELI